jgi:hypothetical protein
VGVRFQLNFCLTHDYDLHTVTVTLVLALKSMRKTHQQDQVKASIDEIEKRIASLQQTTIASKDVKQEALIQDLVRRKSSLQSKLRLLKDNQERQRRFRSRHCYGSNDWEVFEANLPFSDENLTRIWIAAVGELQERKDSRIAVLLVKVLSSPQDEFAKFLSTHQELFEIDKEAGRRLFLLRDKFISDSLRYGFLIARTLLLLSCASTYL